MKYTVKKQGKQWGVFYGKELVEGGFFSRDAAEECCAGWEESHINTTVASALNVK